MYISVRSNYLASRKYCKLLGSVVLQVTETQTQLTGTQMKTTKLPRPDKMNLKCRL